VVRNQKIGYLDMKNVIILGASGNIAKQVIDILVKKDAINLTLFPRNYTRLRNNDVSICRIIQLLEAEPAL
jgi:short-subunit dehydrogenase